MWTQRLLQKLTELGVIQPQFNNWNEIRSVVQAILTYLGWPIHNWSLNISSPLWEINMCPKSSKCLCLLAVSIDSDSCLPLPWFNRLPPTLHRGEGDPGVPPSLWVFPAVCEAGGAFPERPDYSGHHLPRPGVSQNGKQRWTRMGREFIM